MKILTLDKNKITDFAKERNLMIEKCSDDWVLFLDTDEKLDGKLQITNFDNNAYYLKRKNYFLGQYVGTDKIIRLVKKGTGKWVRAVHEIWVPNISDSRCGTLDSPVVIHNTADNLISYLKKIDNYSTLHAKENKKEGKKSTIVKIIFFPFGKFIVTLIKSRNVVFSIMQSLHSYLSWTKMYFRTEQN